MVDTKPVGPSERGVPPGDNRERLICPDCGYVEYENPKVVVGAVCEWEGRVLLARRAIEPRRGHWTIPAGFMELGETPKEGAAREVWEETHATVTPQDLLGIYDIPRIGHVMLIFRAPMASAEHAPGAESEETALFDWDAIPWDHLAFPSVHWALREYQGVAGKKDFTARLDSYTKPWK